MRLPGVVVSLALALVVGHPDSIHAQDRPRARLDIPYEPDADATGQTLSVFFPGHSDGAPILVFFHGGGWRSGDKADLYTFARRLTDEGVIVVVPDYRLAPRDLFPAHIRDAARAVRWTQDHAAEWQANRRCLFVGGHSAGAHLAALLTLEPESRTLLRGSADPIAGIVGVSGVYRIAPQAGGATPEFIRSVFGPDETRWRMASPIELVPPSDDERLPPFALIWMEEEDALAVKESEELHRVLSKQGQPVLARPLPGSDHGGGIRAVTSGLLLELSAGNCRPSS